MPSLRRLFAALTQMHPACVKSVRMLHRSVSCRSLGASPELLVQVLPRLQCMPPPTMFLLPSLAVCPFPVQVFCMSFGLSEVHSSKPGRDPGGE